MIMIMQTQAHKSKKYIKELYAHLFTGGHIRERNRIHEKTNQKGVKNDLCNR